MLCSWNATTVPRSDGSSIVMRQVRLGPRLITPKKGGRVAVTATLSLSQRSASQVRTRVGTSCRTESARPLALQSLVALTVIPAALCNPVQATIGIARFVGAVLIEAGMHSLDI